MKQLHIAALALMLSGAGSAGAAVLGMELDGYVGNAEATIQACGKIAPAGTRRLAEAIAHAVKQEKQTLAALRKGPGYAKEFKKEAAKWHYMTDKNRSAACRKLNDATYP